MVDLNLLHGRVERSVVAVRSDGVRRDGIIIRCDLASTHIMVDGRNGFCGPRTKVSVRFPGGREISPSMQYSDDGDTFCLLVFHGMPHPGLEALDFFDGNLEECQEVFTYSNCWDFRAITRGIITSFFNGGFHHDCSAHAVTRYGSPVVNRDGQLVGVCFDFDEYVCAHDIRYIQAKLEAISP